MPADVQPDAEPSRPGYDGYWYPNGTEPNGTDPHAAPLPVTAVDVLRAVRRFRAADVAMRIRARSNMDMNDSDLVALRHLIAAEERSEPIGPKDLSGFLGISSAATAKLLSRLEASGRLHREPHPSDRRAQVLFATGRAHEEIRRVLGAAHQRMLAAAEKLSGSEQSAVVRFLDELSGAMDEPAEATESSGPESVPASSAT
ncbi:MarR family winged helix-turn-helix transcriptional regulator [Cryobacterium sp. SO2]|uniref:MarR family winged helix-turn-helix transcriptional regulator n=1 Tax=Cryobacterium sp. SO2 TaxID=1897060 RepID=UPI00223D5A00|nr:MarR family winged helix-turn-helix transcriptional regulator [Cryobacterium sp. SO2]WEO79010.1 MarR family winged helix-turn-helix transcriptional regulator [Cryobacterium sp. SO2]